MRGREDRSESLFSYVRLGERVPADHPLRPIRALADEVLAGLNARFEALSSGMGWPSIPLEMLLRAFFSVRSERMLMEQIEYNRSGAPPKPTDRAFSRGPTSNETATILQTERRVRLL